MLVRLLLVIALLTVSTAARAEWTVEEIRDEKTAEKVLAATSTNDDGYRIDIFRNRDNAVRWQLSLPSSSFDRIADSGLLALFRVDDGKSSEIEISSNRLSQLNIEQPASNGQMIRDRLWHGESASPTRGNLRNVLDGKTLSVRFNLTHGDYADTSFDLAGAAPIIAKAINISVAVDPEVQAKEQSRDNAIMLATNVCMASSTLKPCLRVLAYCMSDLSTLTEQRLKQCMAEGGYSME